MFRIAKKIATGARNFPRASSIAVRGLASVPEWATIDPEQLGAVTTPHDVANCVDGKWSKDTKQKMDIPHPLDRDAPPLFTIPDTQADELGPFLKSLRKCPKTGLHNPLKNPERYVQYGEITRLVCYYLLKRIFCILRPRLRE